MENKKMDLKSTVSKQGKYVTQIIHGIHGTKLTFHGLDTHSIKQGQMTKIDTKDGRMIMINDANVLAVEIFSEEK
jgi:hypothetical protein